LHAATFQSGYILAACFMAEGLLKPALQCHSTSIKPGWRTGNSGAHGVMEYSNSQNI